MQQLHLLKQVTSGSNLTDVDLQILCIVIYKSIHKGEQSMNKIHLKHHRRGNCLFLRLNLYCCMLLYFLFLV